MSSDGLGAKYVMYSVGETKYKYIIQTEQIMYSINVWTVTQFS